MSTHGGTCASRCCVAHAQRRRHRHEWHQGVHRASDGDRHVIGAQHAHPQVAPTTAPHIPPRGQGPACSSSHERVRAGRNDLKPSTSSGHASIKSPASSPSSRRVSLWPPLLLHSASHHVPRLQACGRGTSPRGRRVVDGPGCSGSGDIAAGRRERPLRPFHDKVRAIVCLRLRHSDSRRVGVSCFAPRGMDDVVGLAQVCKRHNVGHIVNNAYGVQAGAIVSALNVVRTPHGSGPRAGTITVLEGCQACKRGRVDAIVQSTDKNFMVGVRQQVTHVVCAPGSRQPLPPGACWWRCSRQPQQKVH